MCLCLSQTANSEDRILELILLPHLSKYQFNLGAFCIAVFGNSKEISTKGIRFVQPADAVFFLVSVSRQEAPAPQEQGLPAAALVSTSANLPLLEASVT